MMMPAIKMRSATLVESQDLLLQIQARTHQSHGCFGHQVSQIC